MNPDVLHPSIRCDATFGDIISELNVSNSPPFLHSQTLLTGCNLIDCSLSDEIPHNIIELVGDMCTGKTKICYQAIATKLIQTCTLLNNARSINPSKASSKIKPGRKCVVYVDTLNKFSAVDFLSTLQRSVHVTFDRLSQLDSSTYFDQSIENSILLDCLPRLLVLAPQSTSELLQTLEAISTNSYPNLCGSPVLVMINSLSAFYWQDRSWNLQSASMAAKIADLLKSISNPSTHSSPCKVIVTRSIFFGNSAASPIFAVPGDELAPLVDAGPLPAIEAHLTWTFSPSQKDTAHGTSPEQSKGSSGSISPSQFFGSMSQPLQLAPRTTLGSPAAPSRESVVSHPLIAQASSKLPLRSFETLLKTTLHASLHAAIDRSVLLSRASSPGKGNPSLSTVIFARTLACAPGSTDPTLFESVLWVD
jgi:hypothetical protein